MPLDSPIHNLRGIPRFNPAETCSNGTYKPISDPAAAGLGTVANAINASGEVVGTYDLSNGLTQAFIYNNGVYTNLSYPGGATGVAINDAGEVVGTADNTVGGPVQGFLYDNGTFTTIAVQGGYETFPTGINDAGEITGYYIDSSGGGEHPFIYDNGTYYSFLSGNPGEAVAINSSGEIVGFDGFGNDSGFLTFQVNSFSPAQIQSDYLAITRMPLSLTAATTEANAIDAGTTTETQYVNSLLTQVADTTIPAVAVEASMYGVTGTNLEIALLVDNFLPGQLAYANQVGLDPGVFASLETALVFAFSNETGATTFANNYGPSNTAMPATAAGDAAFAAAATNAIFGLAQTANTAPAILGYIHFLEGFFTANGIVGVPNATPDQIVIAARAGAWGEGVAIALENNLGALPGQVTNFLEDAAHGTAIYSASLSSQPTAAPFQGAATAFIASAASDVQVTGVAAPIDHIVI